MKTLILIMPFIFSVLYGAVLITIIVTHVLQEKLKNIGGIKHISDSKYNQLITDLNVFIEKDQQTDTLKIETAEI